jgi:hypothetical protein
MTTGHSVETQEFLTEKAYAMSANALLAFLIQSTIMVWLLVREPPALGWRQLVPVYVIVARAGRVEQHVEAPSISPASEARHTRPPDGGSWRPNTGPSDAECMYDSACVPGVIV